MSGAGERTALSGVVCDDRSDMRHAVAALLARCGFGSAGTATDFLTLREVIRSARPDVAVVTLPLPGMNGLRALSDLHQEAPDCQLVLLSAFPQLQDAALAAGATALVPEDDLSALQLVLRSVAAAPDRGDLSLPLQRGQGAVPAGAVCADSSGA